MSDVTLRPARPGEAALLSELCLRSKAVWGYDDAFIEACREALSVTEAAITVGHVTVAETPDGQVLGVCEIDPGSADGSLDKLFITPAAIGQGVGSALFEHAKSRLRAHGDRVMTILSDPQAEPAYIHMGARRREMRPSEVFPGRELPFLEVDLCKSTPLEALAPIEQRQQQD